MQMNSTDRKILIEVLFSYFRSDNQGKMQYDVFICHASEDKDDFVRPLAQQLQAQQIDVWYDEFSLSIGDSLIQKIDEGLNSCRFGIVVLSPNFFMKPWAKRELTGLNMREMMEKRNLILPIWHKVSVEDVVAFSPPLADKLAASSSQGINAVIRAVKEKVMPNDSPLIIARNELHRLGVPTPPISDEWWLNMVEHKEALRFPDINSQNHWIFPLPCARDTGRERGLNIASAALQMDWAFDAEERDISPITSPEKVHEFIHAWPGLYECARQNPATLALYAPQLTIPGFDRGFEDVFDTLMATGGEGYSHIFSYGELGTNLGVPPSCPDIMALRHPTFGNYTPAELARRYFYAHNTFYMRSYIDQFEGMVWLLSDESKWLPSKIRQMLIQGMSQNDQWANDAPQGGTSSLFRILASVAETDFNYNSDFKSGLASMIDIAKTNVGVRQDAMDIVERFIAYDFAKGYYDFRKWLENRRNR
ncbi:MAG: hypothetical protein DI535_03870 [Citrobacter freundii]|nr:MAG: hypothetical protein DI535_03870 [Citrobacter freundii]